MIFYNTSLSKTNFIEMKSMEQRDSGYFTQFVRGFPSGAASKPLALRAIIV
ncbi:MAG TPA: hypothetical protein PKL85_03275 [Bacteroidia bacterium]|nr:hypothetical protein [Bacteroidia bacterium]